MPKKTRTRNKLLSTLSNPVILGTIITGVVTVVVALISIIPQLGAQPTPVVILVAPTEPAKPTTEAATQAAPSPTETIAAATDTPAAEVMPQISCLDQWEIVNPAEYPNVTAVPEGNCKMVSIPGILASNGGVSFFGTNVFRELVGIYGIAVKVPSVSVVQFSAHLSQLYNAFFWVALSSSPTPKDSTMILAMPSGPKPASKPPGDMNLYINQYDEANALYLWDNFQAGTGIPGGPPYLYNFRFDIKSGKIDAQVDTVPLETQQLSPPIYLFLGIYKKSNSGSVTLDVTVDNWKVTPGK